MRLGLRDDSEYRLGADPNSSDSDGDGTPDPEETHTSTIDLDDAVLDITGVGDVAAAVAVTDESASPLFDGAEAMVSRAIDFSTDMPFDSAVITFYVDPGDLSQGSPSDYAIGYYDEESGLLTALPTEVDPVAGTAGSTPAQHLPSTTIFEVGKPSSS